MKLVSEGYSQKKKMVYVQEGVFLRYRITDLKKGILFLSKQPKELDETDPIQLAPKEIPLQRLFPHSSKKYSQRVDEQLAEVFLQKKINRLIRRLQESLFLEKLLIKVESYTHNLLINVDPNPVYIKSTFF